jgi:hypothetical protein
MQPMCVQMADTFVTMPSGSAIRCTF